jgi:hypothetical protein
VGVLSQLRVAAAHPEPAAPLGRPGRDAVDYLRIATDPRAAVRIAYNYRVLLPRPIHWLGGAPSGQALAFTVILMTLTALALWWPRLPVRHG